MRNGKFFSFFSYCCAVIILMIRDAPNFSIDIMMSSSIEDFVTDIYRKDFKRVCQVERK